MDSNYLRQMSIQNAQLALDQAKFRAQYQIESDELWMEVQKRINGGSDSLADRLNSLLKDKMERPNVLTIQNIERIVGGRFMVRGIPQELYSFNDYPGRYEYWFWYRTIGSIGSDKKLVLHRRPDFETHDDRYYILENVQHNTTIRIHPNHLKSPKDFIDLLENYLNH
jgi:hypothetical protein